MNRNCRAIFMIIVAMALTLLICGGMIFLLVGDEITARVRHALLEFSLASREDDLNRSVSSDPTPIEFQVISGDTPMTIARNLAAANLITDIDLFYDYVRLHQLDTQLETGDYFLNQTLTIPQLAHALTDANFRQVQFTVLPGWRLEQVAEAIDSAPRLNFTGSEFLQIVGANAPVDPSFAQRVGLPEGASLEGFMYPGMYHFPPNVTAVMLRDRLLQAFLEAVNGEIEQAAAARGYTLYQIVTMASIVQREAIHPDEQPLIAGVYFNRLNANMRLDADPTVQYALHNTRGTWWASITQSDYQNVISDYNTYRVQGLPPSPIASPSYQAIWASVHPEASAYYYFRADCRQDGYHDFAHNYDEHLANGC